MLAGSPSGETSQLFAGRKKVHLLPVELLQVHSTRRTEPHPRLTGHRYRDVRRCLDAPLGTNIDRPILQQEAIDAEVAPEESTETPTTEILEETLQAGAAPSYAFKHRFSSRRVVPCPANVLPFSGERRTDARSYHGREEPRAPARGVAARAHVRANHEGVHPLQRLVRQRSREEPHVRTAEPDDEVERLSDGIILIGLAIGHHDVEEARQAMLGVGFGTPFRLPFSDHFDERTHRLA